MSSLSIGLIGLPNVGKSTLFNALTNASVLAANYPFATIEPNTGIVPVPDDRLDVLAKMYKTNKIIPATVEFVDVAGLVEGASNGEGLGNKFLANIRECDAICHIVRAFEADNVQRADGGTEVLPAADIEIINTELMLADIATIENHLPKVLKEAKADPKLHAKVDYLTCLQNELLAGRIPTEFNSEFLHDLSLLTAKPVIYVFNVDENGLTDEQLQKQLRELIASAGDHSSRAGSGVTAPASMTETRDDGLEGVVREGISPGKRAVEDQSSNRNGNDLAKTSVLFICAKLESELRELSVVEAEELLADYGVKESGLVKLAKAAYSILGLQSFLTAGEKEVRAWTVRRGSTAPQAAGVIHTDFERGFIAAQVVNYNDLVTAGSEAAARAAGKIRTEGKTYIMQPDDIVEFRFNV